MSKYDALWMFIRKKNKHQIKLTFDDIYKIMGIEIDHSFLNYKKELIKYGYQVGKISLKDKAVIFNEINEKQ